MDVIFCCGVVTICIVVVAVVAVVVGSSVKSLISSGEAVVPVCAKNNS